MDISDAKLALDIYANNLLDAKERRQVAELRSRLAD